MSARHPTGWQLRLWLMARPLLQPLMRRVLNRRLARGKEDPARMQEKLGEASLPPAQGQLVWLHAVGLGEVLALRPLIEAMREARPDLQFLITSTARSSAAVIGANLPPGCRHQFLPLDGPAFVARFLDHWRPALSIWSEQDLWPGVICDTARRGIPLVWVNARMNAESFRKRRRLRGLYRDVFARFSRIIAQDPDTAAHLTALGARGVVTGRSLKPAAAPLGADLVALAQLSKALAPRKILVAASTHLPDEAVLLPATKLLRQADPSRLVILAPRLPARGDEIAAALQAAGLPFARRSKGEIPDAQTAVWLADSFGELGLWYRLGKVALIGAGFGGLGGHNPWEAVCLGLPVLHGPDVHNFERDYRELEAAALATSIANGAGAPAALVAAIGLVEAKDTRALAERLVQEARAQLRPLAQDLVSLLKAAP